MRLLPQSLAGQLSILLIAGIIATHQIAQPFNSRRAGTIHQISLMEMQARAVTAYQVISACVAPCDRGAVLQALDADDARFSIRSAPADQADADPKLQSISDSLISELGAGVKPVITSDEHKRPAGSGSNTRLRLSLLLQEGQYLQLDYWPMIRTSSTTQQLRNLLTTLLPVLILVLLFSRRLLKPLQAISLAAEKISRGEKIEPLAIRSPKEFREVACAFNSMQEKISRNMADRTRMLAAISHDFRTPITSLRLRVEMIDDAQVRDPMIRILNDMRQMVDETLTFARDDAVEEDYASVELTSLLRDVAAHHLALGRQVHITSLTPVNYRARPVALKRALNNLLENALRYGSEAWLSVENDSDGPVIRIEDDGPGLAPQWLEKVFEPFARPHSDRSRSTGGSGLGLAIVRSVINAHGGSVVLKNRAQGGLMAEIRLPAVGDVG